MSSGLNPAMVKQSYFQRIKISSGIKFQSKQVRLIKTLRHELFSFYSKKLKRLIEKIKSRRRRENEGGTRLCFMMKLLLRVNLSNKNINDIFCSWFCSSLPLATTRWVRLTLSTLCQLF